MTQVQAREPHAQVDLDSRDAFTEWVRPHWQAMARLASRSGPAAEDILADALANAWRKRAQFDPERGTARNWLLAITADQRRKAWRQAARWLSRSTALPEDGGPAPAAADAAASVDLERALARLTSRQRLAVDLHYYLGLKLSEVAEVMRCSEGTVKSTLSDARGRLRAQLGEDYR